MVQHYLIICIYFKGNDLRKALGMLKIFHKWIFYVFRTLAPSKKCNVLEYESIKRKLQRMHVHCQIDEKLYQSDLLYLTR